jgi:hypothetical protein
VVWFTIGVGRGKRADRAPLRTPIAPPNPPGRPRGRTPQKRPDAVTTR